MNVSEKILQNRIDSIDILRGIVMVIMALDHVRDYFHITANTDDPLNLETTTLALFYTRWITHFCAPIFVFLSGCSIYLQSLRKTKIELSKFLIFRGLWLVFAEFIIISFGWTFNPNYNFIILQVIWAIGISMILLGILIHLPYKLLLALGLLIVIGHNLFDIPESNPDFKPGFWWDLFHSGHFSAYTYAKNHAVFIVYPFPAWTGIMITGYCAGKLYTQAHSIEKRIRVFNYLGLTLIAIFIVLRYTNIYGDPIPWNLNKDFISTFLSFVNVNKYPPSFLFICMTIGPAFFILSYLENKNNRFTKIISNYGRVPFFYYIAHIYWIHLIAAILFFINGNNLENIKNTGQNFPFYFVIPGEGYPLIVVYLIWIFVVLTLYPLCKWYDLYKKSHKENRWLSYL
ncbi:MAG: DUF1624 domain-containing protein [Saprospiraceae bacterium]|nr:DUF1624 domain-containing protein [Saprospiraceae bacterium]MBK8450063.1 DUF1624 domain-containing protein [Saprospiraceae bacterium]MBK9721770.1 DUF1624 domain-containing protein [Saprospiraceae bacterium]